jgi:hypothetical protein
MNNNSFWQKQARRWPVILLLPLLFLLIFFFYPLGNIFRLSLTLDALGELVLRPSFRSVIWFTVWQAALSTGLTLLLGLPAAYLFARYDFRGKTVLRALTTIPFVMPTVVVAAAFRALLGASGPLNRLLMAGFNLESPPIQLDQTLTIILLAHVFYNVTVVVRLVGGFWANLNPRWWKQPKRWAHHRAAPFGRSRCRCYGRRSSALPCSSTSSPLPALAWYSSWADRRLAPSKPKFTASTSPFYGPTWPPRCRSCKLCSPLA